VSQIDSEEAQGETVGDDSEAFDVKQSVEVCRPREKSSRTVKRRINKQMSPLLNAAADYQESTTMMMISVSTTA